MNMYEILRKVAQELKEKGEASKVITVQPYGSFEVKLK